MSNYMKVNEVKDYFKFKWVYQIPLQNVCTNLYSHQQYMRGSFCSMYLPKIGITV